MKKSRYSEEQVAYAPRRRERIARFREAGFPDEALLGALRRVMNAAAKKSFADKARWHDEQRGLSPKEKVAIVLKLQQQEVELNRARAAAGRPTRPMVIWKVVP